MSLRLEAEHFAEVRRILAFWASGIPVYAFGPRAHGRHYSPSSELGLVFKAARVTPYLTISRVEDAFLLSDLPMRVSISDWHDLSRKVQNAIGAELLQIA